MGATAATTAPLSEEACDADEADWLLWTPGDAGVEDALRGCTFVLATTARPRSGTPLMTAREAAEGASGGEEWKGGGVIRTNARLDKRGVVVVHAAVAIPHRNGEIV